MTWLTRMALKKRWLTFLVIALITGASVWGMMTIKMELIPDIEFPVTTVITVYPQAKPGEVMEEVTIPIENVIAEVEGVTEIVSTSSDGYSFVYAMFDYRSDMSKVNEELKEKIAALEFPEEILAVPSQMPQMETNPTLYPIDVNIMPLVICSLTGDIPTDELLAIAETRVMPRLREIDGVLDVSVSGGSTEQVLVNLDPEKINSLGLSVGEIAGALGAGQFGSLTDLENTIVRMDGTKLQDVAEVGLGWPSGTSLSRTNGNTSVSISVMKLAEENTVLVANDVTDELEAISPSLGEGIELVNVFDQSTFIEDSISELTKNALIGFALAVVIVFLFLMAFRASMVTAVSIPMSILIGMLVMRLTGMTINMLTLSAIAIAVGRVIDNSIVVIEVIYRRIQQGQEFREAAIDGVREIVVPISSSTLATVVIFLPLAFVGGIVGEMFIPFAYTVTFALIASLLVALTVIPAMSNFPVSKKKRAESTDAWYQRMYVSMLKWSLGHRALNLVITSVLFLGSFALVPLIGTTFMPSMGEKQLSISIEMPRGSDLKETEGVILFAEAALAGNEMVTGYQSSAGSSGSLMGGIAGAMGGGASTASITVMLDPAADEEQIAEELRLIYEPVTQSKDVRIRVSAGDSMGGAMMGGGVDITIRGDDYPSIVQAAGILFTELQDIEGVADLQLGIADNEAKLDIIPDPMKMMAAGLTEEQMQQVTREFYLIMMGADINRVTVEGTEYGVNLLGVSQSLTNAEMASALHVGFPAMYTLEDVAVVELGERLTTIPRTDQKLSASITGSITLQDVGAVNRSIQQRVDSIDLAEGIEVSIGGTQEMMQESFSDMMKAILIAVVLAYLVIAVTFRSFLNPIIIMVSLPLASIGAMLGLFFTGHPLGISAMMGILMLVGIVLTNAIVLISLVEQLRGQGMNMREALIEAGKTRMRPILMTALTTMIAMLPLAFGLGEGTLIAAELAVVVIGGLFSSTLLTLLVIPVIYSLFKGRQRVKA